MTKTDKVKRTFELAKIAFSQIERLGLAVDPQTYEVMYTYAEGRFPGLNRQLNDLLKGGVVSAEAVAGLYKEFLTPPKQEMEVAEEAIAGVTAMMGELTAVLARVGQANKDTVEQIEMAAAMASRDPKRAAGMMSVVAKDIVGAVDALTAQCATANERMKVMDGQIRDSWEKANRDALTGIYNRKYFDETLVKEMGEHGKDKKPLALLIGDIDHFKGFNDRYGHTLGDQVIRVVGQSLQENVKGRDTAARYGGEEFVVILPNTTVETATSLAETIRRHIQGKELKRKATGEIIGRVTMSIGVTGLRDGDTPETFLDRADKALYMAKNAGRNRVVSDVDPDFGFDIERREVLLAI